MALVRGTDCFECTTSPTNTPSAGSGTLDGYIRGVACLMPANANQITEIGFHKYAGTTAPTGDIGIYAHDAVNNRPTGSPLYVSRGISYGATNEWKKFTGLTFDATAYRSLYLWVCIQMDSHSGASLGYYDSSSAGNNSLQAVSASALPDPWSDTNQWGVGSAWAIYCVYTTASSQSIVPHLNSYRRRRM